MKVFAVFLLWAVGMFVFAAEAKLVVEEQSSALQRTIFAPNNSQQVEKTEKENISVDNIQFSDEKDEPAFPDILMVDVEDAVTSVSINAGQYVAVRLIEPADSYWSFEKKFSNLVFIKKEKRNNIVILLYQSIEAGESKLTFDLIKNNRAMLSRFLNVKVL